MSAEPREVDYVVTFLEMRSPPDSPMPPTPDGAELVRAYDPPVHLFRYLYGTVGADYEWTDLSAASDDILAETLHSPLVHLHIAMLRGCPAGFALLDFRGPSRCELLYFGLLPGFLGHGLGVWLLRQAIRLGWAQDITQMEVNTCTLDHPAALPLYRKCGFDVVREERRQRSVGG